jgi:crossover junction endodeoxyribonuclease RusA
MLDTKAIQGTEVRLALPWPDRKLSPNARCHWAVKAKAVKAAREGAYFLALQARIRRMDVGSTGPIAVKFEFCPPNNRRRDRDNCISSMKAATDGIADALGVDDSRFVSTYSMGQHIKDGAVLVTIGRSA